MSVLIALNGKNITGAIRIPSVGAAVIQFTGANDIVVKETGNLVTFGSLTFVCAKVRSENWLGDTSGELIVGAGGWGKTVLGKFYRMPSGVKLSTILGDAAREVGETIAVDTDAAVGPFYTRERWAAQRNLNRLCPSWHITPDGVTHTGPWPGGTIKGKFDVISNDPVYSRVTVGTESPEEWLPGMTFSNQIIPTRTIDRVTHLVGGTSVRTEVLCR